MSDCLSVCTFVCLSVCLSVRLSCLSVCLCVVLSVYVSVCVSVCVSVFCFSFPFNYLCISLWPGFQARKEPQLNSVRPYVLISVAILLCGALVISVVIAWYFWQKRKLKKSTPPRALIMDSIERSGSSTKPRNEYVFLSQS